uniref:Uncharacterized protein n=1 Tax=Magallana gigas TaxID=29159 RepID=A0A8W8IX59_MAGGI
MEVYPLENNRNGIGKVHDRRSASSNKFNTRTKVQELGKDQESTPGWINTVTSEDFRRKMVTSTGNNPYNISRSQSRQDDYTPTDDSLNKRTKYRTTIIIVLVVSCLVALAVALTVVFVIAKPRNEKQGMERWKMVLEHSSHIDENVM